MPGQRGSPIITANDIIAIHCGSGKVNEEFNVGRLLTPDLIENLLRWG
jgi:V8-like Glu-specific endopeptidase